ncbi:3-oxo-5-alpha-steroid 4-dehydrogenase [Botrytis cinerea]
MAVTLKVTNRSPKNPIKRLPTSIDIDETTTVQDVKDRLAKQAGGWDPNRFGIFDPEQKKILKDRKAFISQHKEVIIGKEILIKDLGPQLGWRTVYIIEYLGPILIHLGFPLLRPYIYSHPTTSIAPLSNSQLLSMSLIVLHFLKREYETVFGYGFSMVTCPNYFFETLAWIGMILVTKSLSTVIFAIVGTAQMQQWAVKKEKQYRVDFGDKYKKKRNVLFPTPGAFIKELTG